MSLAHDAMAFAREAHANQRRKYTGDHYAIHLGEVAGIVAAVAPATCGGIRAQLETMIAVAWLHDCIEDQDVSADELTHRFGAVVSQGVQWLSDLEEGGNRAERKALARARLAQAPGWVQTIKVADLLSNTPSIVHHDPRFAVTYLEEKRLLLEVLTLADPRLLAMARDTLAAGLAQAGKVMERAHAGADMIALPVRGEVS